MLPRLHASLAVSQCYLQQARAFCSSAIAQSQVTSNKEREGNSNSDCAFLRVTIRNNRRLQSPAEVLAIIRTVERRYGQIAEYQFFRDHELPQYYQNMAQVAFTDPASWKRIPESSESFTVTLPRTDLNQSGGVGLDELKELLIPEQFVENPPALTFGGIMEDVSNGDGEKAQVLVKIQRSKSLFGVSRPTGRLANIFSTTFIRWGGFYPLKPIPAKTPLPTQLMAQSATVDHVAMRWALRFHSNMLGIQNPYETRADKSTPKPGTSGLRWEPLPGEDHTPSDTPMPSDIQASTGRPPPIESQVTATTHIAAQPERSLPADGVEQPSIESSTISLVPTTADTSNETNKINFESPPLSTLAAESRVDELYVTSGKEPFTSQRAPDPQETEQQSGSLSPKDEAELVDKAPRQKQQEKPLEVEQDSKSGESPQKPAKAKQKLASFFSNIF